MSIWGLSSQRVEVVCSAKVVVEEIKFHPLLGVERILDLARILRQHRGEDVKEVPFLCTRIEPDTYSLHPNPLVQWKILYFKFIDSVVAKESVSNGETLAVDTTFVANMSVTKVLDKRGYHYYQRATREWFKSIYYLAIFIIMSPCLIIIAPVKKFFLYLANMDKLIDMGFYGRNCLIRFLKIEAATIISFVCASIIISFVCASIMTLIFLVTFPIIAALGILSGGFAGAFFNRLLGDLERQMDLLSYLITSYSQPIARYHDILHRTNSFEEKMKIFKAVVLGHWQKTRYVSPKEFEDAVRSIQTKGVIPGKEEITEKVSERIQIV